MDYILSFILPRCSNDPLEESDLDIDLDGLTELAERFKKEQEEHKKKLDQEQKKLSKYNNEISNALNFSL